MTIGLKVVFSKKAEKDFNHILNYIKKDFGKTAAVNLKSLYLISRN